jgi:anti-sigma factor ChrR (cupin superfamily)
MKKWQEEILDEIAVYGKPKGILHRLLPGRRRFAADTEQLAALMAHAVKPVKPASSVKARLLSRIAADDATVDSFIIAESDRQWGTIFPGVKQCELARADGRLSRLLKIRKGFILPPHKHREIEQAFILEGSCYSGDLLLQKGDFFFANAETKHATVRAIEDCLILLVAHK